MLTGPDRIPAPLRGPAPIGPRDLCQMTVDTAGITTALYKPLPAQPRSTAQGWTAFMIW